MMQGLGLLVLRWKQDAGDWAAGVVVETGSEGAASVATEEGGGGKGVGSELLDNIVELVLANVVDLRLRRWRRGLVDVAAELVNVEMWVGVVAVLTSSAIHGERGHNWWLRAADQRDSR